MKGNCRERVLCKFCTKPPQKVAAEGDIKQIKGGMTYLVKQLSAPPDPPHRRIGFGGDDDTSAKPYGKK